MNFYIAKQIDPNKEFYGQYRWYFQAANSKKICWSGEYYTSEQAALDSISLVKKNAQSAKIYRQNY